LYLAGFILKIENGLMKIQTLEIQCFFEVDVIYKIKLRIIL
jgi:hypothetical protein